MRNKLLSFPAYHHRGLIIESCEQKVTSSRNVGNIIHHKLRSNGFASARFARNDDTLTFIVDCEISVHCIGQRVDMRRVLEASCSLIQVDFFLCKIRQLLERVNFSAITILILLANKLSILKLEEFTSYCFVKSRA